MLNLSKIPRSVATLNIVHSTKRITELTFSVFCVVSPALLLNSLPPKVILGIVTSAQMLPQTCVKAMKGWTSEERGPIGSCGGSLQKHLALKKRRSDLLRCIGTLLMGEAMRYKLLPIHTSGN